MPRLAADKENPGLPCIQQRGYVGGGCSNYKNSRLRAAISFRTPEVDGKQYSPFG